MKLIQKLFNRNKPDNINAGDMVTIKVAGKPKRYQVIAVYPDRIKVIDNDMKISAYPIGAIIV